MPTARVPAGALLCLGSLLAACGAAKGGPQTEATGDRADASASDASSTLDASAGPLAPTANDASAPDAAAGECASSTTQTACVTCCSTAHPEGAAAYLGATIDCMCVPANCAKDCAASLCIADSPKSPDATCAACVQTKSGACATAIASACTADPACLAFDACVGASECSIK